MTVDDCREFHHREALKLLREKDEDLFTECADGHLQMPVSKCDGVHCYRVCDTLDRTNCRRIWKMWVRR